MIWVGSSGWLALRAVGRRLEAGDEPGGLRVVTFWAPPIGRKFLVTTSCETVKKWTPSGTTGPRSRMATVPPIKLVHMANVVIHPHGALVGATAGAIQNAHPVNIVMHQGPPGVNINPTHDIVLGPGDTVLVIASMDRPVGLEARNQSDSRRPGRRITVASPASSEPPR